MPTERFSPEIPAELWGQIFWYCRYSEHRIPWLGPLGGTVEILSCVCRTFRDIIDTTPELWNAPFQLDEHQVQNLPRVERRLRKSGALPLYLTIDLPETLSTETIINLAALLQEFMPRFRTLIWRIHCYDHAIHLMEAMAHNQMFPFLEKLRLLDVGRATPGEHLAAFAHGFQQTCLRCPRLSDVFLPFYIAPFITDPSFFSTVTSFSIQGSHASPDHFAARVLELMSNMPLLKSFQFHAADADPQFGLPDILPLSTPQLQSVVVFAPGPGIDILCHLHAPHLESVEVTGSFWAQPDNPGFMTQINQYFMDRFNRLSSCATSITRLTIRNPPDLDYPILIRGEIFSNLKFLRLEHADIADDALRQTSPGQNLNRLEFKRCSKLTLRGVRPFVQRCKDVQVELRFIECDQICGCRKQLLGPYYRV